MVRVSTGDDGAEHDRLVGLIPEITVIEFVKFRDHLLEFLLSRADLETGVNAVGRENCLLGTGLPLSEQLSSSTLIGVISITKPEVLTFS